MRSGFTKELRADILSRDPVNGRSYFQYATAPWDFDLRPWIERGKLLWCVPGSGNRVLADPKRDACPYLDMPGEQRQLVIARGHVGRVPPPEGESIEPFGD
jgi:hypothetical protein